MDKKNFCIIVFALFMAIMAISLAQNAQETADINNVFAIVVNNTDLYPAQRTQGVTYWANESPIAVYIIFHSLGTGAPQVFDSNFTINGSVVLDRDTGTSAGSGFHDHWSFYTIVPKGANYSITNSTNVFNIEWREYPILSGKNGTLSINQTFNTSAFVPYSGATQNLNLSPFTLVFDGNINLNSALGIIGGGVAALQANDTYFNGSIFNQSKNFRNDSIVSNNITLSSLKFNKTAGLTDVITGITYINTTAPRIFMTDTDSTGAASIMLIDFFNSTGHEVGFVGDPSGSSTDIIIGSIDNGVAIYAGGNIRVRYYANGSVNIAGIAGSGQDYVCVDAGGMLIRSNAAC